MASVAKNAFCQVDSDATSHPSVTDRYYTRRYSTDIKGKLQEDQCVLFHNNRICVVTIAPSHPLVAQQKHIMKIDFQVTEQTNRLMNKVSGKGKRGGQWLTEISPLCKVSCKDGTEYTLYSCIKGKLVEVNESLLTKPHLLTQKPHSNGYIAIVLPKLKQSEPQKNALTSPEKYEEILQSRISHAENAGNEDV